MSSNKTTARIAGLLYFSIAVFSGFAFFYRGSLIVPGDASATAAKILASEWLFRISFLSDLIGQMCFILLGSTLYVLLKPVDRTLASLMAIFVFVSVPITMLNMQNQLAVVLLLGGADYLKVFEPAQLNALAMFFLNLLEQGILIAQIFWGIWLFPLGILIYRSDFLPRILGILLIIGCFGYIFGSLSGLLFSGSYLFSSIAQILTMISAVGELSFIFWLLIKGVNESKANST